MFASSVKGFIYPENPIYDRGVENSDFLTGKLFNFLLINDQSSLLIVFIHLILISLKDSFDSTLFSSDCDKLTCKSFNLFM